MHSIYIYFVSFSSYLIQTYLPTDNRYQNSCVDCGNHFLNANIDILTFDKIECNINYVYLCVCGGVFKCMIIGREGRIMIGGREGEKVYGKV